MSQSVWRLTTESKAHHCNDHYVIVTDHYVLVTDHYVIVTDHYVIVTDHYVIVTDHYVIVTDLGKIDKNEMCFGLTVFTAYWRLNDIIVI